MSLNQVFKHHTSYIVIRYSLFEIPIFLRPSLFLIRHSDVLLSHVLTLFSASRLISNYVITLTP